MNPCFDVDGLMGMIYQLKMNRSEILMYSIMFYDQVHYRERSCAERAKDIGLPYVTAHKALMSLRKIGLVQKVDGVDFAAAVVNEDNDFHWLGVSFGVNNELLSIPWGVK